MDGLIDFRKIAAKYTPEEHARRADRYYANLAPDSPPIRKPFAEPLEAVELSAGIGAILSGLNLFHGAKVLDFGAGTCWLGRILASLGCEVTSCDVSPRALEIGRRLADRPMHFATLDGGRLPFEDGAFDRVVVFDALHHCPDQPGMIREFERVLGEDGIAAFHEPGPNHSRLPQSQYEMRSFDVIEGDIDVEALFAEALAAGFVDASLVLFVARPVWADLEGFNDFIAGGSAGLDDAARRESKNRRVFFLFKGGRTAQDSRGSGGLQATMSLQAERTDRDIRIHGTVTNTGPARWLPSGSGKVGAVNLGVHLYGPDGALVDNDYARVEFIREPLGTGVTVAVDAVIPAPGMERFTMALDLVSEGVSWFEVRGSRPISIGF